MKLAMLAAEKARGLSSPNPFVGAVIVMNDKVIATGWTQQYGGDHAEVQALNKAGAEAQGADMYVTLEPCSHYGKTPPCALAIIKAGIQRVFIGIIDPNPLVAGKGIKLLQDAGIAVQCGILERQILRQLEYFLCFIQHKRPFVTLKTALSLDGKYAAQDGSSRWISNQESRAYTHKLRSQNDAILCGVKTVLIDNPMLNVRLRGKHRQPIRVVLDPFLETPPSSAIATTMRDFPTLLFCDPSRLDCREATILKDLGAELIGIVAHEGLFDLNEVLSLLGNRGISSLLLESGSGVAESFLKAGLVDKCLFFYGAKIVGGCNSPLPSLGLTNISNAIPLQDMCIKRFGDNFMLSGYPQYST